MNADAVCEPSLYGTEESDSEIGSGAIIIT